MTSAQAPSLLLIQAVQSYDSTSDTYLSPTTAPNYNNSNSRVICSSSPAPPPPPHRPTSSSSFFFAFNPTTPLPFYGFRCWITVMLFLFSATTAVYAHTTATLYVSRSNNVDSSSGSSSSSSTTVETATVGLWQMCMSYMGMTVCEYSSSTCNETSVGFWVLRCTTILSGCCSLLAAFRVLRLVGSNSSSDDDVAAHDPFSKHQALILYSATCVFNVTAIVSLLFLYLVPMCHAPSVKVAGFTFGLASFSIMSSAASATIAVCIPCHYRTSLPLRASSIIEAPNDEGTSNTETPCQFLLLPSSTTPYSPTQEQQHQSIPGGRNSLTQY